MKVYHGSSSRDITKFSFRHSRRNLDFGKGVYFTTNFDQAKEWSCKYSKEGAVYQCEVDFSNFKVLSFREKTEDLIYVLYLCRIDLEEIADVVDGFATADVITGLMLDGNMKEFEKIAAQFNEGDISPEDFTEQIKLYENGYDQICIKSKAALKHINTSIERVYYTQKSMGNDQVVQTVNIGDENNEI